MDNSENVLKTKFWKVYIPIAITLITLVFYGVFIFRNEDLVQELLNLSLNYILLLIVFRFLTLLFNSITDYIFYRGLNLPIGFLECMGLKAINALANQLPFAGGLVASGFYLKQKFSLAYTRFLSATAAVYVSFISANGILGLGLLSYWAVINRETIPEVLIVGFSGMALSIISYWIPLDFLSGSGKLKIVLTQTWA